MVYTVTTFLLPLHRGGGFGGDIISDAVDALDLVGDAAGHARKQPVRQGRVFAGHEVVGDHGAQGEHVIVSALVAHHAHGARVGEHGKILVGAFAQPVDLLAEDGVGVAQNVQLFFGQLAHDAHGEAGPGERLALDQKPRQTEPTADAADLILEQPAQRLDHALEIHRFGQAAHVVVAFDGGGLVGAGFDHVGVDRALRQIFDVVQLFRFFLEDLNKFVADDLALGFGVGHARQLVQVAFLGVDADELQVAFGKNRLDLVAFIFAHKAVVDEHAHELVGDGLGQQRGADRGIDPAGKREQHLVAADLFADGFDLTVDVILHGIIALCAADRIQKLPDHLHAVFGVDHLGVELHAVQLFRRVFHGGDGAVGGVRRGDEALGHGGDAVGVAHEHGLVFIKARKKRAARVADHFGLTVFAHGAAFHPAAEGVAHELKAVADAEDRHAHFKQRLVAAGRIGLVNAHGAAGGDDADGVERADALEWAVARQNHGINAAFAHAARDQLLVLAAEIQHDHRLIFHRYFSFLFKVFYEKVVTQNRPVCKTMREFCRDFCFPA